MSPCRSDAIDTVKKSIGVQRYCALLFVFFIIWIFLMYSAYDESGLELVPSSKPFDMNDTKTPVHMQTTYNNTAVSKQ